MDGAQELAKLIKETDQIITGIEELQRVSDPDLFDFFRIPKHFNVAHASLVLKDPIANHGRELEKPNPQFHQMMEAIASFG